MQACSLSASVIIHNRTVQSDKRICIDFLCYMWQFCRSFILSELLALHQERFSCSHVAQVHKPKLLCLSITCASGGGVVFLVENKFHSRRHRKVATRHILPNIQISLSLKKFSMMQTSLFLPQVLCPISASLPSVVKESRVEGKKLLTWGETTGLRLWNQQASVAVHWLSVCCSLQSWTRTGNFTVLPPTHQVTHSLCTRLPPCLPPLDLKGENMPSLRREQDRWCWVQGVVAVRRIRCLLLLLLAC